jgi:hypothetical protein
MQAHIREEEKRNGKRKNTMCRVGQNHIHTVYIRFFGREIINIRSYTVYVYGWTTLIMWAVKTTPHIDL